MRTNEFKKTIIYAKDSYRLVGIAMEIHRTLGNIYQEKHYQKLFEEKIKALGIPYEKEKKLVAKTKDDCEIGEFFVDFIIATRFCSSLNGLILSVTMT